MNFKNPIEQLLRYSILEKCTSIEETIKAIDQIQNAEHVYNVMSSFKVYDGKTCIDTLNLYDKNNDTCCEQTEQTEQSEQTEQTEQTDQTEQTEQDTFVDNVMNDRKLNKLGIFKRIKEGTEVNPYIVRIVNDFEKSGSKRIDFIKYLISEKLDWDFNKIRVLRLIWDPNDNTKNNLQTRNKVVDIINQNIEELRKRNVVGLEEIEAASKSMISLYSDKIIDINNKENERDTLELCLNTTIKEVKKEANYYKKYLKNNKHNKKCRVRGNVDREVLNAELIYFILHILDIQMSWINTCAQLTKLGKEACLTCRDYVNLVKKYESE